MLQDPKAIISVVGAKKNENLSIAYEERVKTCARLAKKALFTDDPTNCLGLESPTILRVRSRNRTPSPPARSTAQRCTADESSFGLQLASR
jgi:hypothetical protein